jgi:hypothetical protein
MTPGCSRAGRSLSRLAPTAVALLMAFALTSCGRSAPDASSPQRQLRSPSKPGAVKAAARPTRKVRVPRRLLEQSTAWITRADRAYRRGTYAPFRRSGRLSLRGALIAGKDLGQAQQLLLRTGLPVLGRIRAARGRLGRLVTDRRQRRLQAFAINQSLAVLVQEARTAAHR